MKAGSGLNRSACVVSRRSLIVGGAAAAFAAQTAPACATLTAVNGTVVGKNNWLFFAYDDPRKVDERKLHVVTGLIGQAVTAIRGAGIDVALAFVPSKARVYQEYLPSEFQFTAASSARYQNALTLLRESGALVPDLERRLKDLHQSNPDTHLYFIADTHWAAAAAEPAAAFVGQEMLKAFKLPASKKPGLKLGKPETALYTVNDLSRNLDPALRNSYPPEKFLRSEVAKAGGGLLDSDEHDVAVVGNSFMQPDFNFVPALSATLNRPVSLTWKVHTVGPYKMLLNYLQSAEFKRNRPKALVWNFHEIDMELPPSNTGAWPEDAMTSKDFVQGVQTALNAH
jgi:alginate O-acetyltransferase complex protein AlgJ